MTAGHHERTGRVATGSGEGVTVSSPERATQPAGGKPQRSRGEAGFTVAVLATMLTVVTVRQGHAEFPGATLLTFTLLAWLPLLFRTRWPLPVLGAVVLAESLRLVLVPVLDPGLSTPIATAAYQPVPLATMAAAWTVASRVPRTIGWASGGAAAVALLAVSLLARPLALIATDMVMFDLVLIATGAGFLVSSRRERAARLVREHQAETREQVVAERLRIARDLHDVLAHHLTLVNAQAGVADYLIHTDVRAATSALHDISRHTRRALDELRDTVGLLRQDGDCGPAVDENETLAPVPGLERLPDLVSGFRSAGAAVSLSVTGAPLALTASADLAAYRIVQEALTNAAKHAPGARAEVALRWSRRRLDLGIENGPGRHRQCAPAPGTGHGLIGMRERANACGGSLSTERSPGRGFVVRASIPATDDTTTSIGRLTS